MDSDVSSDPPLKKRRFFNDPEPQQAENASSDTTTSAQSPPKKRFFQAFAVQQDDVPVKSKPDLVPQSTTLPTRHPLVEQPIDNASNRARESPSVKFDEEMFASFVGENLSEDVLSVIREKCDNDLERAVNMYFDGTWKNFEKSPQFGARSASSSSSAPAVTTSPVLQHGLKLGRKELTPDSRYVGAFGVEGWATRSGVNLLKHGDIVRIERQKIRPPSPPKPKAKLGVQVAPNTAQRPKASSKRVDVIVRFTNINGMEIGRLAKDTANWVSTLIDQKICKFEGTCVYAPERIRTNDTVFLQLRVSLLASAFFARGFTESDNRVPALFEEKETPEEKDLRLRQVALVRLFQEINLMPTRINAAAAKHQRQGLLQAAEMAETKDKEAKSANTPNREDPGSSPPEEGEDGQELEQDQLDALYKKAQSFDFSTPEAEPADTFAMTLRPYQKQSLYWMMAKEKDEKSNREPSLHPLWEEYAWPTKDVDDRDLPLVEGQASFYVNPYSGELSLEFPVQEQHCLGGILADEMGLGKTIQMLSLIHSNKSQIADRSIKSEIASVNQLPRLPAGSQNILSAPRTTLVIAPMSLLSQWQSETEKASIPGTIKSYVYYGTEKNANLQAMCCKASSASAPDIVITSYGVVLSEYTQIARASGDRSNHSGIFSLNFWRVILDEAHTIKNRSSKTARACYEIAAEHRWVLTGTPIVNRLEDLFSLVRFLGVEPWNNFSFWRTFITVPFESKDFMRALDVVQTVLEPLVMRRTKDMKTPDGQPLVPLPPKQINIVDVELSKTEREIYDYIYMKARRTLANNVEAGTVFKAYTTIFAQILRLRQSCCHPVLVRNKDIVADEEEAGAAADIASGLGDDMDLSFMIEHFTATTNESSQSNAFGAHVLEQIRDEAKKECPICAEDSMIEQTVTGCWHSACKKCLLDYMKHQTDRGIVPRCPNCREEINYRDLFEVVRHDDDPDMFQQPPRISLQRLGVNNSSAKVVALIRQLRDVRRAHPRMKSVVFSQFTSFLTLIEPALARANIDFLRLDGTMAQRARAAVLDKFQEVNRFTVLLISLRAGGVGLNLTSAQRVFMMDPWWSFAVEAQAIDRVHRMGQEEEVKVMRFIVKDSVEERMLKVQERKKFIATSLGMMSDEEKKLQRIEDIKELLS